MNPTQPEASQGPFTQSASDLLAWTESYKAKPRPKGLPSADRLTLEQLQSEVLRLSRNCDAIKSQRDALKGALEALLSYSEQNICLHEETHRGGVIWEICDRCGKKWADDEGGKPADAHEFPEVFEQARAALKLVEGGAA